MNTSATNQFIAHVESIKKSLAALQQQAEDHFGVDPDAVHWGHVGDVARLDTLLAEILNPK